ncbi:cytochrome P450 [Streptomyces sp. NPDC002403]
MPATSPPVPTAPHALPGLGHALSMARNPLDFVVGLNAEPPMTKVRLGWSVLYMLNDPELLHTVLVSQESSFVMGRLITRARPIFGEGLGMNILTAGGFRLHEPRLAQRRIIQPAFRSVLQESYNDIIARNVEERIAHWRPGHVIDLCHTAFEFSSISAVRALLGDCGAQDEQEAARLLHRLLGGVVRHSLAPTWWEAIPVPANRRYRDVLARLDTIFDRRIRDTRRPESDTSPLLRELTGGRDHLGNPLSGQQIRDHLRTILSAGAASAADTVPWMFYELDRNPEVARRVHDEVDSVLQGKPPTPDAVRSLSYCTRVAHETLRLHTPQWLLSRRAIEPVQLGDTLLPEDSTVSYSPYALHRNQRWYPDPLRFDPDRWLPENVAAFPRCAFIPFSTGSGKCIGNSFAMAVLVLAMAGIAAKWRLRPVATQPPREVLGLTVSPNSMQMVCEPRH